MHDYEIACFSFILKKEVTNVDVAAVIDFIVIGNYFPTYVIYVFIYFNK